METTLDLPVVADQHAFNLERWEEICADPVLAALDHRIETDRFGHPIMIPPPGFDHGDHQFTIGLHLRRLLKGGKVVTECPVSTTDGVKGVDVVWISSARLAEACRNNVLVRAPTPAARARVLPGERTRPRVLFSAPSRKTAVARARPPFLQRVSVPRGGLCSPTLAFSTRHFARPTTLSPARRCNNEFTTGPHSLLARCDF